MVLVTRPAPDFTAAAVLALLPADDGAGEKTRTVKDCAFSQKGYSEPRFLIHIDRLNLSH